MLTMHSCRCVRETAAYTQTSVAQAAARHATARACRSPAWILAPSRALQREWLVARRVQVVIKQTQALQHIPINRAYPVHR